MLAFGMSLGCSSPGGSGPAAKPEPRTRAPIVVTERGPTLDVRLVAIDETGDRLFSVIALSNTVIRDTNPAISPDGQWIVFASSRGRSIEETSLWLAPLGIEVEPIQITSGSWVDTHPTWMRDGSAIVFASTRAGSFDLWRISFAVSAGRPRMGEPQPLTHAADQELTPSVAPDGSIAYAALRVLAKADDAATAEKEGAAKGAAKAGAETAGAETDARSRIEVLRPDGTITAMTEGPGDSSPSYSPDGRELAWTRPEVRDRGIDSDLWVMPSAGGPGRKLIDLPPTDESGPVWSRDGRYLFATSLLRGADGRPLFSSVIFFEVGLAAPVARVLVDRVGAVIRLTPTISDLPLRDEVLRQRPVYLEMLREVVREAIERSQRPAAK
jgi:Tol biopolymer transport system component